ncbi:MAG: hypothetical protein C0596_09980 [Marinilabiliales bacterium]|nr:MAG: hypothetical protein C0596_09980 [Marinilabiliales bacterium]
MKTKFTTIIVLLMSIAGFSQEWTVEEVGTCPMDKTYGIVLADVHGDEVQRLYVSTRGEPSDGAIYEWTYNGSSWELTSTVATGLENLVSLTAGDVKGLGVNKLYAGEWGGAGSRVFEYTWNGTGWDEALVESPGQGVISMIVGDARGDEVQRLYASGYIIHREYTWTGTDWSIVDINSTYGTEGPALIGEAKNDGVIRYYTPGNRIREFSWNGSSYDETASISGADGWPETVVVQDTRNDGVNRVMTQDYNGTYEYTWNGSSWDEVNVSARAGRSFLFAAKTKADGKYYIYNTFCGDVFREYSYNSGTMSYDYTNIDAATGATAIIDVGTGRNDNVVRLYTPGYASGKIYEITNVDPLIVGSTGIESFTDDSNYIRIAYMTNKLFVENVEQSGVLQVYDLNGKQVLNKKTNPGTNTVNLDGYNSGMYIARFFVNGKLETKKFIIR